MTGELVELAVVRNGIVSVQCLAGSLTIRTSEPFEATAIVERSGPPEGDGGVLEAIAKPGPLELELGDGDVIAIYLSVPKPGKRTIFLVENQLPEPLGMSTLQMERDRRFKVAFEGTMGGVPLLARVSCDGHQIALRVDGRQGADKILEKVNELERATGTTEEQLEELAQLFGVYGTT